MSVTGRNSRGQQYMFQRTSTTVHRMDPLTIRVAHTYIITIISWSQAYKQGTIQDINMQERCNPSLVGLKPIKWLVISGYISSCSLMFNELEVGQWCV